MRVKIRFISDIAQPAMFVDLRWLPRPGETVDVAYRKSIEVVEVVRIENDKRCDAIVRGKLKDPVRRPAVPAPEPPRPAALDSGLGSKSFEELLSFYRDRVIAPAPDAFGTA